jgi:hypothetical protein
MNVFEKVHAAADSIGIYSCPDVKSEKVKRKTWITYNLSYEQGRMYGDDEAHDRVSAVQVHLFLPKQENFFHTRKLLRDALIAQGFTHPEMVNNSLEGRENEIRHIVLECQDDEESEE